MRILAAFFFLLISVPLISQSDSLKYFIQFTDKNNNGYSINQPQAFLSQRAIERRVKQNITIVENDLPVTQLYIDSLATLGANILHRTKWFNGVTISTNDPSLIALINTLDFVQYEERTAKTNTTSTSNRIFTPIPPVEINLGKTDELDYGVSFTQIAMMNGHLLHEEGFMGDDMIIAVLDAGFYNVNTLTAFQRLRNEGLIIGTYDFVDIEESVYEDNAHGMYVLSVMGGYLPGRLIGTAPNAKYLLLRTEEAATELRIEEDNWVAAAEFADSIGADIINTSLGYTTFDRPHMSYTYSDMDGNTTRITIGSDIAASKGMLLVTSAGNEGMRPWAKIGAPADGHQVLAVGATDSIGRYAAFSSRGPSADGRIKPNIAAQGFRAWAAAPVQDAVTQVNGTSFSSPIVAGLAACLWQAHPQRTSIEIFNAIQLSGSQYASPDTLMGYGIPNFYLAHQILSNDISPEALRNAPIAFPNPFKDQIKVLFKAPSATTVTVEIFDVLGKLFYRKTFNTVEESFHNIVIDELNNVQRGVYFVRIQDEVESHTLKILKQ